MKEAFELLQNKRYRAIGILILYLFFFIFVAYIFNQNNKVKLLDPGTEKKDPVQLYCDRVSYEYDIKYNILGNKFDISGERYKKDSRFKYDENDYYLKDGKVYIKDGEYYKETNVDFDIYDSSYICELVKKGTLVSKSEEIQTDGIIYKYSVKDDNRDQMIYVSTTVNVNLIDEVKVDLSDDSSIYTIDIRYKNIGNVDSFTSEFKEEVKEIEGVEE